MQGTKTPGQDHAAYGSCGDASCSASTRMSDESDQEYIKRQQLQPRLCLIQHKILVLSGKGGVGKSTVAVNLAVALGMKGKKVGLLDIDLHGPSIPTMLGLEGRKVCRFNGLWKPIDLSGLKVMSLGFLTQDPDKPLIWRGPIKAGMIEQLLMDVNWGDLDYLIVDCPPGTGDEPLSICQLIDKCDGAVVVTTPQKVAAVDVRKSINFCKQLELPVLGVVENMSGFVCPKCGEVTSILRSGGGQRMATDMNVPFLGSIPMDPRIAEAGDDGKAFVQHFATSQTAALMQDIIQPIAALKKKKSDLQLKVIQGND